MLLLLLAWTALLALTLPVGLALVRWTGSRAFERPGDRLVLAVWLGLIAFASALLALAFALPLSPGAGIGVGLGGAAAALASSSVRRDLRDLRASLTPRLALAFLALASGVAIATAQPISHYDTGLYHVGAIRWLSELGAVEGIGLVHHRLGFGSSWFALAAPFNPEPLRSHAASVLNGFALLVLCLQTAICAARALRGRADRGDWMMIAGAALLIPIIAGFQRAHVSASPDPALSVLVLLVGWSLVRLGDDRGGGAAGVHSRSPGPASLPLMLGLAATAMKPPGGPAAAVAAVYLLAQRGNRLRSVAVAALLTAVLLGPWLAYELLTTGCPAFPLPICADVAWSLGSGEAEYVSDVVAASRLRDRAAFEGGTWIGGWLTADLRPWLIGVAVAAAALGLAGVATRRFAAPGSLPRRAATLSLLAGAGCAYLLAIRAEEISMTALALVSLLTISATGRTARWLAAVGLLGIGFVLYAAPDTRFALGYMAILAGRLVILSPAPDAVRSLVERRRHGTLRRPGLAGILVLLGFGAALAPVVAPTTTRGEVIESFDLLLPPENPQPAVTVRELNGIRYRVPADESCWSSELPCAPATELDDGVILRDPKAGIEAGFERGTGD